MHAPQTSAPLRAHPYRAFALRAGLGAAIVAFLLWHYAGRAVIGTIERENFWWFFGAVLLYLAGQLISSWRWRLLARAVGIHGGFAEFVRFYFIGMFTNLFVPGLIGGDAARAIYLGRKHDRLGAAIASTVADRIVGLLGLFWIAAIAAAFFNMGGLSASITRPAIAIGLVALAGFIASPLTAKLIYVLPRRLRRAGEIVVPYLHRPRSMILPIALSVVLQLSLAIAQWMVARGLGIIPPLSLFVLIVPIANVLAALPITLNGLGVRETTYLVMFGMAGIRHDDAIALGLLWFAATMIAGLTGAIAFVTTPTPLATSVSRDDPTHQAASR